MIRSVDQRFVFASNYGHPKMAESIWVVRPYNGGQRQHRVVRVHMNGVPSCLFYSLHLLFASCMVERANNDRLSDGNIPCRCQVGLFKISRVRSSQCGMTIP